MKITEEAPDIFSFQLFSQALCDEIIEWAAAERLNWKIDRVYQRYKLYGVRHSLEHMIIRYPYLRECLNEKFKKIIRPTAQMLWQCHVTRWFGARLIRYEPGDYLARHTDYTPGHGGPPRLLSLACSLSDDCSGGQVVFPRQRHTIRPRAGKAILFPSSITHPHEVQPLESGVRYAIVARIN